jgi:hypothetical protein
MLIFSAIGQILLIQENYGGMPMACEMVMWGRTHHRSRQPVFRIWANHSTQGGQRELWDHHPLR